MSDKKLREALAWGGPKHPGLEAARKTARWHLGDPNWADRLLMAYLDPAFALEALRIERGDDK